MTIPYRSPLLAVLFATFVSAGHANDFPTVERVTFVRDCMRAHPGPDFEMVNKCSCAVDRIAAEVKYDDYVAMSTVSNAMSIAGERGNDFRDNESLKPLLKQYRELRAGALKACLITRE